MGNRERERERQSHNVGSLSISLSVVVGERLEEEKECSQPLLAWPVVGSQGDIHNLPLISTHQQRVIFRETMRVQTMVTKMVTKRP